MKKEKYIAFIGDSYCASYSRLDLPRQHWQNDQHVDLTYTNIVPDHYGCKLASYGFGGKSWWYSWHKFNQNWAKNIDQIEAMVFCHTNRDRINTTIYADFPCMSGHRPSDIPEEMNLARDYYFKYIMDSDFDQWAQTQYFKMIKEKYSNIKTIHLHCFANTMPYSNLLPGVVYNTPLVYISIGEIVGTKQEVDASFADGRANHLNAHNNKVLAEVIIDALNNYIPGQYELPLSKFDHPNANAKNWPLEKYWIK